MLPQCLKANILYYSIARKIYVASLNQRGINLKVELLRRFRRKIEHFGESECLR